MNNFQNAMEKTEKNISEFKVPLIHRIVSSIHSAEANFSKSVYKFWCKLKGGKFERRKSSRPNACLLVTKRSSHLFASSIIPLLRTFPVREILYGFNNLFSRKDTKQPTLVVLHLSSLELEVYELICPESASFGQGQKEHSFAFKKKENCVMCGRCFEIRENDRKIIGNFYEN